MSEDIQPVDRPHVLAAPIGAGRRRVKTVAMVWPTLGAVIDLARAEPIDTVALIAACTDLTRDEILALRWTDAMEIAVRAAALLPPEILAKAAPPQEPAAPPVRDAAPGPDIATPEDIVPSEASPALSAFLADPHEVILG